MNEINRLIERLKSSIGQQSQQHLSFSQPVSIGSALLWVNEQTCQSKFYWCDSSNSLEIAALGICHEINHVDATDRFTTANYLGGVCFDEQQTQWSDFPACRFILPRVELRVEDNAPLLICHLNGRDNAIEDEINDAIALLMSLQPEPQNMAKMPKNTLLSSSHLPEQKQWQEQVEKAISQFAPSMQKVVLSRQTTLHFNDAINPWQLLHHWQKATPNCYQFAFQFSPQQVFLGCPPERLFIRDHKHLISEAVAGTVLRGKSHTEDEELAAEMLSDPKLILENELVRQFLEPIFLDLCEDIAVDKMMVLKLKHIQHLKRRIQGVMKRDVDDATLLRHLHPTPAVCGFQKHESLDYIRNNESYDRGWYSGAVGILAQERSEFSVAIRSALLSENTLTVFSGAGIVEGSVSDLEWQELDNKISTLLNVL